ncbi:MAG: O-antigen ligase family protein [Candidatus Pacebacteria bacterium]|nr:O-antigen ligase family protein [Candidatus Paceibacterota bacterium]
MDKKIIGFLSLEVLIVFLMSLAYLPQEFSFVFLLIFFLGIIVLDDLDSLLLFILSIPFFVVFPPSSLSDAMSVWRFAVIILFLKIFLTSAGARKIFNEIRKKKLKGIEDFGQRFSVLLKEIKKANYYKILIPLVAFFLIALLSLFSAASAGAGIKKIIFISSAALLFPIIMMAVKEKKDIEKVIRAVFISLLVMLFFGYAQFVASFFVRLYDFWGLWDNYVIQVLYGEKMSVLLSYSNTWFSYYEGTDLPPTLRMFSLMPDSHSFSMLMIMLFAVTLFYFKSSNDKKSRKKYFILMILSLMAIFFSGSRGAWAGWLGALAVALGFYYFGRISKKNKLLRDKRFLSEHDNHRLILVAVSLFAILLPVSSFFLNMNQDAQIVRDGLVVENRGNALLRRTKSIYDFDETSNKGRLQIWKESAVSVAENPLSGVGYGNFSVAIGENVSTTKLGSSAHNIYLDIAVEIGLLGLLFFLLILWYIARKLFDLSYRLKDDNLRFLSGAFLVAFAWLSAYGFFDVVLLNDKVLIILIIIIALLYRAEQLDYKGK